MVDIITPYPDLARTSITPSVPGVRDRRSESGDALTLLQGRLLHVAGSYEREVAAHVRADTSGLVLTADDARQQAVALRRAHPNMPLLIEPHAARRHIATVDAPFDFGSLHSSGRIHAALQAHLDADRESGADVAFTPTGQVAVGDVETMRAVINVTNDVDRKDIVVALNLQSRWLSDPWQGDAIVDVIESSRHVVGLSFANSSTPINSIVQLRNLRRILHFALTPMILHRTDLAGVDAFAHNGVIGMTVGSHASGQHLPRAGKPSGGGGRQGSPQLLVTELGRFLNSRELRAWAIQSDSGFVCTCAACQGHSMGSLNSSDHDRMIARRHNMIALDNIHSATLGLSLSDVHRWWHSYLETADLAHSQLEMELNTVLPRAKQHRLWRTEVG